MFKKFRLVQIKHPNFPVPVFETKTGNFHFFFPKSETKNLSSRICSRKTGTEKPGRENRDGKTGTGKPRQENQDGKTENSLSVSIFLHSVFLIFYNLLSCLQSSCIFTLSVCLSVCLRQQFFHRSIFNYSIKKMQVKFSKQRFSKKNKIKFTLTFKEG